MIRPVFEWGGRSAFACDCLGLANQVRLHGRVTPIDLVQLDWVYDRYPTLDDSPLDLVESLARSLAEEVGGPEDYDLAIITNLSGRSCLGTLVNGSVMMFTGERARLIDLDRFLSRHPGVRWVRLKDSFLVDRG